MEYFQIIISSIFSLIGAGSLFFIAMRSFTVGTDVAEMKEILRDMQRTSRSLETHNLQVAPQVAAGVPTADGSQAGDWPSVSDPAYNQELPYDLRASESPRSRVTSPPESW